MESSSGGGQNSEFLNGRFVCASLCVPTVTRATAVTRIQEFRILPAVGAGRSGLTRGTARARPAHTVGRLEGALAALAALAALR